MDDKAEVPSAPAMDDVTFLKHWNKRHRLSDVPSYRIDIPYSPHMNYSYLRAFHQRCHNVEKHGGTVNDQRPNYDHIHDEEDE